MKIDFMSIALFVVVHHHSLSNGCTDGPREVQMEEKGSFGFYIGIGNNKKKNFLPLDICHSLLL